MISFFLFVYTLSRYAYNFHQNYIVMGEISTATLRDICPEIDSIVNEAYSTIHEQNKNEYINIHYWGKCQNDYTKDCISVSIYPFPIEDPDDETAIYCEYRGVDVILSTEDQQTAKLFKKINYINYRIFKKIYIGIVIRDYPLWLFEPTDDGYKLKYRRC